MAFVTVGDENSASIDLYYEDHGIGSAVVLIHGYPLDGRSWERQQTALLEAGYRVITYDRRGFGRSSQPTIGYDYDTFAGDLDALIEHLRLDEVILVGFSMGTGEVVRYLARYGSVGVARAVLIGAIPPYLRKGDDNPDGVDAEVFEGIKKAVRADRFAYLKDFFESFYNADVLTGTRVSPASAYASYACVDTWLTDFRDDLSRIDLPVLLIHGDADRILPYENTAARLPGLIKDLEVVTVAGGPHNVPWTHPDVVNPALLDFLAK